MSEQQQPRRTRKELLAEISMLRERNQEASIIETYLRAELAEKANRIEELKAWGEDWRTQALKNRDRIEELEKQQDIHCGVIQDLVCEDSHVRITTAQIDAAWGLLRNLESIPSTHSDTAHDILECIGIIACEECGGSGEKDEYPDPNDDLPAPGPCPSCNGHGWRLT